MSANDKPGCCGVAARLPKNPGTQKLTPPSSAFAASGAHTIASANVAARKTARISRPCFPLVSIAVDLLRTGTIGPLPVTAILSQDQLPLWPCNDPRSTGRSLVDIFFYACGKSITQNACGEKSIADFLARDSARRVQMKKDNMGRVILSAIDYIYA